MDPNSPPDPRLTTGKSRARARQRTGTRAAKSEERRELLHRERVKLFVEHYKATGDLTASITVSTLSRGQAREIMESHPELREDVCLTMAKAGVTPERVIKEIGRIALCDPRQLFDEEGRMLPVNEWPEDVARAVSGMDATQKSYGDGDEEQSVTETTYKPRFWDKPAMLRELVRMLRMASPDGMEPGQAPGAAVAVQRIEVVIVAPGEAQASGRMGLILDGQKE